MKLWFCYGNNPILTVEWIQRDGHLSLLKWLLREGSIDAAEMVVTNKRNDLPKTIIEDGVKLTQQNRIETLQPAEGDVIWVRSGFRQWIGWITDCINRKIWILFYDAGAHRTNWPYWNVVLNDLIGSNYIQNAPSERTLAQLKRRGSSLNNVCGRLYYHYAKPIAPIFRFDSAATQEYDLCINASYIYDEKGQHFIFRAVLEYEYLFGKKLRCVLPGFWHRCKSGFAPETTRMRAELSNHPNITFMDLMSQERLRDEVYSRSTLFAATTGNKYGCGDRAPVEAGLCGCPLLISEAKFHATYTSDPSVARVLTDARDAGKTAMEIGEALAWARELSRASVAEHFRKAVDVATTSGPQIKRLLDFLRAHPQADNQALRELVA